MLTPEGQLDSADPYLVREYGVERYERLLDTDFGPATQYCDRTPVFWEITSMTPGSNTSTTVSN